MSENHEKLLKYFQEAEKKIDSSAYQQELKQFLRTIQREDIVSPTEHKQFIELIAVLRRQIEENDKLHGDNYLNTMTSLLAVGADGIYTGELRFMFELIQNVDDCEYDDLTDCHLEISFEGNNIVLTYNEKGFSPANVFAITGIAEAAKNVDAGKVEIGEKGLGFKSVFGISESVLIESGYFAFRLDKEHFTVPVPVYPAASDSVPTETVRRRRRGTPDPLAGYQPVNGTRLTLHLADEQEVQKIYRQLVEKYCTADAVCNQNPMLFLNRLTSLRFIHTKTFRELSFVCERKEKEIISDDLAVERNILVQAKLDDYYNGLEHHFEPAFAGDRYTLTTVYDQAMCQSRYGSETRLPQKTMTLQAIFPHTKYLKKANQTEDPIELGTLYSFMPTQVRLSTPVIIHAPFKLNGARENIDDQKRNAWFCHTYDCLKRLITEALKDISAQRHEDVLYYIPEEDNKDDSWLFQGCPCLKKDDFSGEEFLKQSLLWGQDGKYHTPKEVFSFPGSIPHEEQQLLFPYLSDARSLFLTPAGLKSEKYSIKSIASPYKTLLTRMLVTPGNNMAGMPAIEKWANDTEKNAVHSQLDTVFGISSDKKAQGNTKSIKAVLTREQLGFVFQYPVFTDLLCEWAMEKAVSGKYSYFHLSNPAGTIAVTDISPESSFSLEDVGSKVKGYLSLTRNSVLLVDGSSICLPMDNVLILSKQDALSQFASLCEKFDINNHFSISLKLADESRQLNDAEASSTDEEYMDLLRSVRLHAKQALGDIAYKNYLDLLNQSGMNKNRFIHELLQNADDCDYPEGCEPSYELSQRGNKLTTHYNEIGFTKRNVRAITAIGESTKKRIVNNSQIGEKGVGFKSVFALADEAVIHSNGFHFSLSKDQPTIPRIIQNDVTASSGTTLELTLHNPESIASFDSQGLLSLCLCLRKLKNLKFGLHEVTIVDDDVSRMISIGRETWEFDVFKYPFVVRDIQALQERQGGSRVISENQIITCYIPKPGKKFENFNFLLYNGLPTAIQLQIPMAIDAPFELTTARDGVLDTRWNIIVRENMYKAIYAYTEKNREKLGNSSLRFIHSKTDSPNTFSNDIFKNSDWLNNYREVGNLIRSGIYIRMEDGSLKHLYPNCYRFPVIIREALKYCKDRPVSPNQVLDYTDGDYNSILNCFGWAITSDLKCLDILSKLDLSSVLHNSELRKNLYKYLEDAVQKSIAAIDPIRHLCILPVWDREPGKVLYKCQCDIGEIYTSPEGKNVSDDPSYWILNTDILDTEQYFSIYRKLVQPMDNERAVDLYKRELLKKIQFYDKYEDYEPCYNTLLSSYKINPQMVSKAIKQMTPSDRKSIHLKSESGEILNLENVFISNEDSPNLGKLLQKYCAAPECLYLARLFECQPIEDITFKDMKDYPDQLEADDLEDLQNNVPQYSHSIMRDFFEKGKISQELAEQYGIIYVNSNANSGMKWKFPERTIQNLTLLKQDMRKRFNASPKLVSEERMRTVQGWKDSSGQFRLLDRSDGRSEQISHYAASEDRNYSFCQMCGEAEQQFMMEADCIRRNPNRYLPMGYLCLCPNCSKKFTRQRDASSSRFTRDLYKAIKAAPLGYSGAVKVNLENYDISLTFTQIHLAQLQFLIDQGDGPEGY